MHFEFGSQRICALLAKESVHMRFHGSVIQAHADAVVVEEEDAVATPILQYRVDKFERQPLVTPRIHEEECRYELGVLKLLDDIFADLACLELWFVLELADSGECIDFPVKRLHVGLISVVERRDKPFANVRVLDRPFHDQQGIRGCPILVPAGTCKEVDVSYLLFVLGIAFLRADG